MRERGIAEGSGEERGVGRKDHCENFGRWEASAVLGEEGRELTYTVKGSLWLCVKGGAAGRREIIQARNEAAQTRVDSVGVAGREVVGFWIYFEGRSNRIS